MNKHMIITTLLATFFTPMLISSPALADSYKFRHVLTVEVPELMEEEALPPAEIAYLTTNPSGTAPVNAAIEFSYSTLNAADVVITGPNAPTDPVPAGTNWILSITPTAYGSATWTFTPRDENAVEGSASTVTIEIIDPGAFAWQSFAEDQDLPYEANWHELRWAGLGLTALPEQPYPQASPTGLVLLSINNLTNIDSLSALETVGLSLWLHGNQLPDVDGLTSLSYVGRDLNLSDNQLTNLDGLHSLVTVGKHLTLYDNNLTNVDGLQSLTSVGGNLELRNNSLTNVNGLRSLNSVKGTLMLNQNPGLVDLSGLADIQDISVNLYLDAGIQNRANFVGIPTSAWICKEAQAGLFPNLSFYAQQSDVCVSPAP